jgi:hypothetical protein
MPLPTAPTSALTPPLAPPDRPASFNASGSFEFWNRVSAVLGPSGMSFYVNDTLVLSVPATMWYTGAVAKAANPLAPFNRPFHMLLNLAVGGRYPAATAGGFGVTDTRRAPFRFLVDWVRVYREVSRNRSGSTSSVRSRGRRSLRGDGGRGADRR